MPLLDQELFSFPKLLSSSTYLVGLKMFNLLNSVADRYFSLCTFYLVIVLSVLQITKEYFCAIFKLLIQYTHASAASMLSPNKTRIYISPTQEFTAGGNNPLGVPQVFR